MSHIDLFLDLSLYSGGAAKMGSFLDALADPDGLGALTVSATCWLPEELPLQLEEERFPGWRTGSGQVLAACNEALEQAAQAGRPLLVLLDAVTTGNEAVSELLEVLRRDALFGFAMPRQANPRGGLHKVATGFGDDEVESIPRRVLSEVPEIYIVPELLSSCFLVRQELVANLGPLDESYQTLAGAWLHYLCRARRIGFRCVVANTAVITGTETGTGVAVPVEREDFWKLHRIYPDMALAQDQLRQVPAHAHETLLARAFSSRPELRRTLLIDGRGMGPCFNGTSHGALGLLDGLAKLKSNWRITLLAHADAAAFHRLKERYPDWGLLYGVGPQRFLTAFRISQPWAIETMAELHRMALFNIYSILDTIAWDVIYPAIERLEESWWFLSDHADGIVYNSIYTRDRYRTRFPVAPGIREFPLHLSFHPRDYVSLTGRRGRAEEPYILLVGNDLDHKYITPTLELLTQAFPFQRFKALGSKKSTSPLVTALPSGLIPEDEVERLYAEAQAIVFPSFYEGFGIPLLKGLSYGHTVIARASELLFEVAGRHRGPGRLITYDTPTRLVEVIGRLLHGLPVAAVPLGTLLADVEEPMDWVRVARNVLEFVQELSNHVDTRRWLARERAVRQFSVLKPERRRI